MERRRDAGRALPDAVREATDYCIGHGIMRDCLLEHCGEVFGMFTIEWNEEMRRIAEEAGLAC